MQIIENPEGIYRISGFSNKILAAFSGRNFTFPKDLEKYLKLIGASSRSYCHSKQIQGNNVICVDSLDRFDHHCEADAMITQTRGVVLGILTADCLPVFLEDPEHHAVAVVHAGWRGLDQAILGETLRSMKNNHSSAVDRLRLAFGPAIRACCYKVGAEFRQKFPNHYIEKSAEKGRLDLIGIAIEQLTAMGVQSENIFDCGICTSCQNDRFFSFRKENTAERILSVISIMPEE